MLKSNIDLTAKNHHPRFQLHTTHALHYKSIHTFLFFSIYCFHSPHFFYFIRVLFFVNLFFFFNFYFVNFFFSICKADGGAITVSNASRSTIQIANWA